MPKFDAAVALDEATLNGWIASLFRRKDLVDKAFAGQRTVDAEGLQITVSYAVTTAPTISLSAPSDEQWAQAIKAAGEGLTPLPNAFVAHFPAIALDRTKADGTKQSGTIALAAIVAATATAAGLSLDPQAVIVDLSGAKPIDRAAYKLVLIPQLLKQLEAALPKVQMPTLPLPAGMAFGPVSVSVGGGRLSAIAKLQANGAPDPSAFADLPKEPFVMLVDGGVVQAIVDDRIGQLKGKTEKRDGDADFKLGKAAYSISATLNGLTAAIDYGTNLSAALAASLSIAASAGLNVLSACPVTAALGKL